MNETHILYQFNSDSVGMNDTVIHGIPHIYRRLKYMFPGWNEDSVICMHGDYGFRLVANGTRIRYVMNINSVFSSPSPRG